MLLFLVGCLPICLIKEFPKNFVPVFFFIFYLDELIAIFIDCFSL